MWLTAILEFLPFLNRLLGWLDGKSDLARKLKERADKQVIDVQRSKLVVDNKNDTKLNIYKYLSTSFEQNKKYLWCPFALWSSKDPKMTTRGKYKKGYPIGAVVHYSVSYSAESTLKHGTETGNCFFVIGRDGQIYQRFPLSHWGYHAGASSWNGLESLNDKFVGIELVSLGKLKKKNDSFLDEYGRYVDPNQIRESEDSFNIKAGAYQKFTIEQEESLFTLIRWLKFNNPEVFNFENVCGHDECSPDRKTDPGASLRMPMIQLRNTLKESV